MKDTRKPAQPDETTDFFESMPMTAGHYVYRDDTMDAEAEHDSIQNEIRTTAIITLVLVAIVAVALGVLVWQGIGTLRETFPPASVADQR